MVSRNISIPSNIEGDQNFTKQKLLKDLHSFNGLVLYCHASWYLLIDRIVVLWSLCENMELPIYRYHDNWQMHHFHWIPKPDKIFSNIKYLIESIFTTIWEEFSQHFRILIIWVFLLKMPLQTQSTLFQQSTYLIK